MPGASTTGTTVRSFGPVVVATASSESRHLPVCGSISIITSSTVTTTRERRRGPGVVPAAPGNWSMRGKRGRGGKGEVPVDVRRGGSSPLRCSQMRRYICRFCAVDTKRGCENQLRRIGGCDESRTHQKTTRDLKYRLQFHLTY